MQSIFCTDYDYVGKADQGLFESKKEVGGQLHFLDIIKQQ